MALDCVSLCPAAPRIYAMCRHNLKPTFFRLKRFDPQVWLPTLTWLWGTVTIAQGFVKNQAGLLGIRFCESITSRSSSHIPD